MKTLTNGWPKTDYNSKYATHVSYLCVLDNDRAR